MSTIFVDEAARETIEDWVRRFEAKLRVAWESVQVPTRLGSNQVRIAGPADATPVVALPGALASSAHLLHELYPLCREHRVYAVDVVGQSPHGAPARPGPKGPAFSQWLSDVMDGLALERAHLLGVSWGGGVALNMARHRPERIDRLVLVVPAGMARGSLWRGITELGWPMWRYKRRPTPARLRAFCAPQMSTLDDDWLPYLGDAVRCYQLDMRLPPLVRPEELAGFHRPVMVLAAEDDVHFPGAKVLARAREVFPNLVEAQIMTGTKHAPPTTDAFREQICAQIGEFLGRPLG